MSLAKAILQRIPAHAGRDRFEMRNQDHECSQLGQRQMGMRFFWWICMMKRLIVIMVALGAHNVPANAASLSPFAHDAAGRLVLEFYPATAVNPTSGSSTRKGAI